MVRLLRRQTRKSPSPCHELTLRREAEWNYPGAKTVAFQSAFASKPRQLGNVARYATCLILGKHLGHAGVVRVLAPINIREQLAIGVADFQSARYLFNGPRRWKAGGQSLWSEFRVSVARPVVSRSATGTISVLTLKYRSCAIRSIRRRRHAVIPVAAVGVEGAATFSSDVCDAGLLLSVGTNDGAMVIKGKSCSKPKGRQDQ